MDKPWRGYSFSLAYAKEYGLMIIAPIHRSGVLYAYSPYLNKWFYLPSGSNKPPFKWNANSVYDLKHKKLLVLGGTDRWDGGQIYNETWAYDIGTQTWTHLNLQNYPDMGIVDGWGHAWPSIVYDADVGAVVYTKKDGSETWILDQSEATWKPITVQDHPSSTGHTGGHFSFNSTQGEDVLFSKDREIWTLKVNNNEQGEPYPPVGPKIEYVNSKFRITWQAPDKGSPISKYNVYRAQWSDLPGPYTKIAETTDLEFEDSPLLTNNTFYTYYVSSSSLEGAESAPSLPVCTKSRILIGVVANVLSAHHVEINWHSDESNHIVGYNIYRSQGPLTDQTQFAKLNQTILSSNRFIDNTVDLSSDKIAHYFVTKVNLSGQESGPSPLAHTIPDWVPGLWLDETTRTLHWLPALQKNISGYHIWKYHKDKGEFSFQGSGWLPLNNDIIQSTSFKLPDSSGFYTVRAVNMLGQEGFLSDFIVDGSGFPYSNFQASDNRLSKISYDFFWDFNKTVTHVQNYKEDANEIKNFVLYAYPNPFNPQVTVEYDIPQLQSMNIVVYNLRGQLAGTIFSGVPNSTHGKLSWNAGTNPSGIYFIRLTSGSKVQTKRVLLIK